MSAVNVHLVGNIATETDAQNTPTGKTFVRFRVATNERYRDNTGEWKSGEPVFWDCEAWNAPAQAIAANLTKGEPVIVVGIIRSQNWKTEDGQQRTRRFVKVEAVGPNLAVPRKKADAAAPAAPAGEAPAEEPDAAEEWAAES